MNALDVANLKKNAKANKLISLFLMKFILLKVANIRTSLNLNTFCDDLQQWNHKYAYTAYDKPILYSIHSTELRCAVTSSQ